MTMLLFLILLLGAASFASLLRVGIFVAADADSESGNRSLLFGRKEIVEVVDDLWAEDGGLFRLGLCPLSLLAPDACEKLVFAEQQAALES